MHDLSSTFTDTINIAALLLICMFIFAILGNSIFGYDCPRHFGSVEQSRSSYTLSLVSIQYLFCSNVLLIHLCDTRWLDRHHTGIQQMWQCRHWGNLPNNVHIPRGVHLGKSCCGSSGCKSGNNQYLVVWVTHNFFIGVGHLTR